MSSSQFNSSSTRGQGSASMVSDNEAYCQQPESKLFLIAILGLLGLEFLVPGLLSVGYKI